MLDKSATLTPPSNPNPRSHRCFPRLQGLGSSLGRKLLLAGAVVVPVLDAAKVLAATALAVAVSDTNILTRLVLPVDVDKVPSPVCSQCKAGTKKVSAGGDGSSTGAEVTFMFGDDTLDAYMGRVRISVRLKVGRYREAFATFMTITDGQTVVFELGNGDDWTWDDVGVVFFELMDAQ